MDQHLPREDLALDLRRRDVRARSVRVGSADVDHLLQTNRDCAGSANGVRKVGCRGGLDGQANEPATGSRARATLQYQVGASANYLAQLDQMRPSLDIRRATLNGAPNERQR